MTNCINLIVEIVTSQCNLENINYTEIIIGGIVGAILGFIVGLGGQYLIDYCFYLTVLKPLIGTYDVILKSGQNPYEGDKAEIKYGTLNMIMIIIDTKSDSKGYKEGQIVFSNKKYGKGWYAHSDNRFGFIQFAILKAGLIGVMEQYTKDDSSDKKIIFTSFVWTKQ